MEPVEPSESLGFVSASVCKDTAFKTCTCIAACFFFCLLHTSSQEGPKKMSLIPWVTGFIKVAHFKLFEKLKYVPFFYFFPHLADKKDIMTVTRARASFAK